MEQQLDLLTSGAPRFPRARRKDSSSSHEAAAIVEQTGVAAEQLQRVLEGVRRYPGCTSHELALTIGMDRYAVARRLPELTQLPVPLARKAEPADHTLPCAVVGRKCCRWYPLP